MPQLINFTLQGTGTIQQVVPGSFSAPKITEVVCAKGTLLELMRINTATGRLETVFVHDTFSFVRRIEAFKIQGNNKDHLVVTSDSGRIVVLDVDSENQQFTYVHKETYGKTGIRRVIPGEYLACDPKGRAIMIGAVDKMKFLYQFNRDPAGGKMRISSPLESHKSKSLCLDICSVDVGFDSPVFASLEVNYEPIDKAQDKGETIPEIAVGLAFWELDIGLNHVVKKCTLPVPETAHKLISVAGGTGSQEGVSGILVCCDNYLVFRKPEHDPIYCAYPRRLETPKEKGIQIIAHASHRLKQSYVYLLQSDLGDIYKVDMKLENGEVKDIICRYFDSIPITLNMAVLRTGALFAANQSGNHLVYQFKGLGSDNDPACSSSMGAEALVPFKPRALKNLEIFQSITSMGPLTQMKAFDVLGTGSPQLLTCCGSSTRSSLRILQQGMHVREIADNELPGRPSGVWAFKSKEDLPVDDFLLVSFSDASLVLTVGELVEECADSPFRTDIKTLLVKNMSNDVIVQVHTGGIRFVQSTTTADKGTTFSAKQWQSPSGRTVVAATANQWQVAIALQGGDLFVFELNTQGQALEVGRKSIGDEIVALALPEVIGDRRSAAYMSVASLDATVRLLSLDRQHALRQVSVLANPYGAQVEGIEMIRMPAHLAVGVGADAGAVAYPLFLFVGLASGIQIRSLVDTTTGHLLDQRVKFLDNAPIKLQTVRLAASTDGSATQYVEGVMALGRRPYLNYANRGKLITAPLHYGDLTAITTFNTREATNGFMATMGSHLKVFELVLPQGLGAQETFCSKEYPLTFTPRQVLVLPPPPALSSSGNLIMTNPDPKPGNPLRVAIIETDHGCYDVATRDEIKRALQSIDVGGIKREEGAEVTTTEEATDDMIGAFRAGPGKWGSLLRTMNPETGETHHVLSLDVDEAALSASIVSFKEFPEQPCLVVGTTFNQTIRPRNKPLGSLKVYAYDDTYELTLLHSTPMEHSFGPMAMCPFKGQLLVGVGNKLRLLSLGKKKLLRKGEYSALPECIAWIKTIGERIFVGDSRQGFHCLRYNEGRCEFQLVADMTQTCFLVDATILDYHTVVGSDKFGNVFSCRLPEAVKDAAPDNTGINYRLAGGAVHKMDRLNFVHMGDIITSLEKVTFSQGSWESIVYSTVMGGLGVMVPLLSHEDLDFFELLEMVMRDECPGITGRDHMSFRSYYGPVKGVIDGDLCGSYPSLPRAKQDTIADRMDKKPAEVLRKIEEVRSKIM